MEVEQAHFNPQIPELKRKGTPEAHPEVDPEKKAKLATPESALTPTPAATIAPENGIKDAEIKEITEVAEEEAPITAEDIRKLKELLRQEEAKLLLIKRIKASIAIPEQVKKPTTLSAAKLPPSLQPPTATGSATVNPQVTVANGIHASPAVAKMQNAENSVGSSAAALAQSAKGKSGSAGGNSQAENNGISHSSGTSKLEQVTASFERSKSKREELKNELNQTLNSITTMPASAHHDVNFFPTVVNAEFLALLGLEKCVGRLKRDEQSKNVETKRMECSKCFRDFSPSWKYDKKGRLLCTRCINNHEFEQQTISQINKFKDFSDYWEKKEDELRDIELQMEKDQKELRQQQIEAEKIRQAKYRQQEKERKSNLMSGDIAGVNRTALENLMRSVNTGNRHRPKGNNIGQASTLMNQINQMTHEQTLQMIHRLHQMSNPSATNSSITADYLANLKVQKIKEQMMEQQKQKELQKQMELERIRKRKQQEELVRSQLERQRQQQQQRQNNASNSDLLRAISQIQNLTNLTQTAQNNSPAAQNAQSGTHVNQQLQALQQLLAVNGSGQQNLLTNLIASGILGGRNAQTNSQPNYAELLKPPTAHTNKR